MAIKYYLKKYTAVPRHLVSIANYKIRRTKLPPNRFIIFGEGRCGSTALVSRLGSLQDVHCDNEVLAFRMPFPYEHILMRAGKAEKPVYGCKVLAFHIRDLQPIRDRDIFVKRLHEDGFKIIHLRRTNLIHHAVSNIRANKFGYHQQKAKKRKKTSSVHVELEELMAWMKRTEGLYAYEDLLLKGLPRLTLTYEEHISSDERQRKAMPMVCDFLDIPYAEGDCAYMKISPRSLRDSIENYDEVVAALSGTKYESFLDAPDRVDASTLEKVR